MAIPLTWTVLSGLRTTCVLARRLCRTGLALVCLVGLRAAESPGKFAFHVFPPAPGQNLGYASRPVSDGRGGFWFLNMGHIWRFDASGYRACGAREGFPEGPVRMACPEPSTGMWFLVDKTWYRLSKGQPQAAPRIPEPINDPNLGWSQNYLAMRNEGLAYVRDGKLHVFDGSGAETKTLPAPGSGEWIKGWKNPRSEERLVVGDLGLARWDGHAWRIQSLAGLLDGRGWDVFRTRSGALWVRSDRDLARVEPAPARFGPRLGFTRNSFVSMAEDAFGRVWTNGPEGLACVDGDQVWRIDEREGLYGYHSYWPIAFDPQGSLWTISAQGFQRLKGGFLWSVQEQPHGLPRAMIFTVHRLKCDGHLYAGTHDGLYRLGTKRWEIVKGTERWALFTVVERPNGEIWCAGNPPEAHYQAVLRIRPGISVVHPRIPGLPGGAWAQSMLWEGPDLLWCATDKGLFRVEAKGEHFQAVLEKLPGADPEEYVYRIGRTPGGRVWLATDKGVYFRWQGAWTHMGRAEGLAADDTVGAFDGPNGELWLLHDDSQAITRLRTPQGGRGWEVAGTFTKGHPLAFHGASSGWTDPAGIVWIQTSSDLVRWDGKRAEHHTNAYGVPIDKLWEASIHGEPDGRFYVGSISGLVCYDPRYYQPIPDPPALEGGEAWDGRGQLFRPGAALPFRKTGVSFGLMLPLVDGIEDLRCETRLLGLDEEWHPLEGNLLRFPGLPPGRYVLEARTARRDGLNGPVLSFPFTILKPWYARAWAILGWLLLTGGAVFLVLRWRTWALRRDRVRLEGLVSERTSDLVQANEALVQALAEVKTLKGLVPICCYCKKIRDDAGFWNQLERYLQDHSDAKFSHGICPECEAKLRDELEMKPVPSRRAGSDAGRDAS